MALQHETPLPASFGGHVCTIRVDDLHQPLVAAKLRRHNGGRTCQLAAFSGGPAIEVDCASSSRHTRPGMIAAAQRMGPTSARCTPMSRGHIARVYERVNAQGRREVLHTWGIGIRALRAEPRYVLNGGTY